MDFLTHFNILSEQVFDVCKFKVSKPQKEDESSEYHAHTFKVNNKSVHYRHAKITPTKVGQFATFWKRAPSKVIAPYDSSDDIDLLIVTVKAKNHLGQFVFPKSVLIKHGVISVNGKGGKRALRVYPPWDETESKQASKTQSWQLNYFCEIPKNELIDVQKFKSLYEC